MLEEGADTTQQWMKNVAQKNCGVSFIIFQIWSLDFITPINQINKSINKQTNNTGSSIPVALHRTSGLENENKIK